MAFEMYRDEETGLIYPIIRCDSVRIDTCAVAVGVEGWYLIHTRDVNEEYPDVRYFAACSERCFENVLYTWGQKEDGEYWEISMVQYMLPQVMLNTDTASPRTLDKLANAAFYRMAPEDLAAVYARGRNFTGSIPNLARSAGKSIAENLTMIEPPPAPGDELALRRAAKTRPFPVR